MKPEIRQRARKRLDTKFSLIRPVEQFAQPPKGWIRGIRDALGMSLRQLGDRLGIAGQSVRDIEESEANGTIQLKTLRRVAEVVIVVVVPDSIV